jgi:hypothetical protein
VTGSDGAYQFPRLTAGRYRLCAQAPRSAWLNPCQWGLQPTRVTLSAEQPIANAPIVMKKGAVVPIRIEDPGQLLAQHEGKTRGADLLVGVAHDAFGFMTARVVSRDTQGESLEVVIPFDSARMLVVRSAFIQLADGFGTALSSARATMIPVMVSTGQRPAEVRLRVTGASQP